MSQSLSEQGSFQSGFLPFLAANLKVAIPFRTGFVSESQKKNKLLAKMSQSLSEQGSFQRKKPSALMKTKRVAIPFRTGFVSELQRQRISYSVLVAIPFRTGFVSEDEIKTGKIVTQSQSLSEQGSFQRECTCQKCGRCKVAIPFRTGFVSEKLSKSIARWKVAIPFRTGFVSERMAI